MYDGTCWKLVERSRLVNGGDRLDPLRAIFRLFARIAVFTWVAGCSFHASGLARPDGAGVSLEQMDGHIVRLVTGPESFPLRALDGHSITIDGQRIGRTVRVGAWTVDDGLHGMPVWVGPVRLMGAQIGIEDHNSQAFYWVDDDAARTLAPHADKVVLLEGYIDGPHRIHVLYWRSLDLGRPTTP